jgi:pilus assembly protein Flp/PilA
MCLKYLAFQSSVTKVPRHNKAFISSPRLQYDTTIEIFRVGGFAMIRQIVKSLTELRRDESATAMLEYSILIGLITVAVIAIIVLVGGWVTTQWQSLCTALSL